MEEQPFKELLEYITPVIAALSGVAGYAGRMLQERMQQRSEQNKLKMQLDADDEKIENERFRDTVTASQKMSEILMNVVEPMTKRITMLESDAANKQSQILELNEKVINLTNTLHIKDVEIEELKRKYNSQVEMSNNQERKIQAQAMRITELEDELNRIKKSKG